LLIIERVPLMLGGHPKILGDRRGALLHSGPSFYLHRRYGAAGISVMVFLREARSAGFGKTLVRGLQKSMVGE